MPAREATAAATTWITNARAAWCSKEVTFQKAGGSAGAN